jgi:hypothetical protein
LLQFKNMRLKRHERKDNRTILLGSQGKLKIEDSGQMSEIRKNKTKEWIPDRVRNDGLKNCQVKERTMDTAVKPQNDKQS